MMCTHNPVWDERFISIAEEAASWSKDPSRKIGAVVVRDRTILSTGYNGFPRGVNDTEERYNDRTIKYKLISHAEENAIFNAANTGVSLAGATMYVAGLPTCSSCARGIIQTGITNVIMKYPMDSLPDEWRDSWKLTQMMFEEAGVSWKIINKLTGKPTRILLG